MTLDNKCPTCHRKLYKPKSEYKRCPYVWLRGPNRGLPCNAVIRNFKGKQEKAFCSNHMPKKKKKVVVRQKTKSDVPVEPVNTSYRSERLRNDSAPSHSSNRSIYDSNEYSNYMNFIRSS